MQNQKETEIPPLKGEEKAKKPSGAGKVLNYAVRYLVPLAFTVGLVWYMFSHIDMEQMVDIIRHGVNYWWILFAMVLSVFSHIIRAARWNIQLRALGIKAPFMALCCSIFGTYALNLVFPRLGEIWRCAYVSKREHASFSTVVGSMVGDRLSDTLMVLLITFFTFFAARNGMTAFMTKYKIGQDTLALLVNPLFWLVLCACGGAVWALFHFGKGKIITAIKKQAIKLWHGFIVIGTMKGKWKFIILTLMLWSCYYFQLYVAFFAFSFTADLCSQPSLAFGLIPCLVAFVLSSIGMAIPSNGGLGPWNIAVAFGLAIYGITETEGTTFSILVWSAQTVMLILLGIFTMVYISVNKPRGMSADKLSNS